MEELIKIIEQAILEPKTAIMLSIVMVAFDIITGWLKAKKQKKINSSISRDGFFKKLGWFAGLVLGLILYLILGTNLLVILVATTCVVTELISIVENLSDLGCKIEWDSLEKIKNKTDKEEK